MAMIKVYDFSQSADKFQQEQDGVCQALSAQWIVARAAWHASGGRAAWKDASWIGAKSDMARHVDRIYGATRSARETVKREERDLMQQEIERFNGEKVAFLNQEKRKAALGLRPMENPPSQVIAGYTQADLERRLDSIYIPTLPRMLTALMKDIAGQSGLVGAAVHSYSDVKATAAQIKVLSHDVGYNLIDIRDRALAREGGAHAVAAEIRTGETRLFDPNYGEWVSEPPQNAWSAFGVLLAEQIMEYRVDSVKTLSVIHFKLA